MANKFYKWFIAETPIFARVLQGIAVGITMLPIYYTSLPERFKQAITDEQTRYITISGIIATILLQLFHKTENK